MEEDLVKRAGIRYTAIPAAGVHGVGLKALPGNLVRLARGVLASRRILREFNPQVLFFTGGYVAVPMALAGTGVPSLLFVPDIEPGLALKTLARFATAIALTTADSLDYFSNGAEMHVTGYPLRAELADWDRASGRILLGLDPEKPVLLVLGGSKGARSINRALAAALPSLLPRTQVLHITGRLDWEEIQSVQAGLPLELASAYHPFPYLHEEIGAALASADLVLSRAGASVLGEYPCFGLPAVLVPYPYAWRYQKVNADYLTARGAAVLLKDEDLPARLLPVLEETLFTPVRLESMSRAMRAQAQEDAAGSIAAILRRLASPPQPAGGLA